MRTLVHQLIASDDSTEGRAKTTFLKILIVLMISMMKMDILMMVMKAAIMVTTMMKFFILYTGNF